VLPPIELTPAPDLFIQSLVFSGGCFRAGKNELIRFRVTNKGQLASASTNLAFFVSSGEADLQIAKFNATALNPGKDFAKTVRLPFPPDLPKGQSIILRAVVDYDNVVDESHENNNEAQLPKKVCEF
jgi:subtilase family serine protease